jgi:hypothetical protein
MRPFALALLAAIAACAAGPPKEPPAAGRPAQMVNATVLTNGCQTLGNNSAKLAESAMHQLVEGCATVPGGSAEFSATLQPGGRIDIAGAAGQDVIPTCVLKHALVHKVPLTRPCRLDVKLEQMSLSVPYEGGMD